MKKLIFETSDTLSPLLLRVFLGSIIFADGAQKLFGWFGGYGFNGTMSYFTETVGLPWIVGFSIILLETFGAVALVAGIATRLLALSFTLLATGIIVTVHIQYGFYMNWEGSQGGEGIEFFLLWIAISLGLMISGGGRLSVDRRIQAV